MNGTLTDLLKQLEQFGTETDERESDRTKEQSRNKIRISKI